MDEQKYLILPKDGEREDTRLAADFTDEEIVELKKQGYVEVDEADFNLLIGNGDKEYCIADDGSLYERPPYVPSLDEARAAKIAELKAIRDAKEEEPVQTEKGLFDYTSVDKSRIYDAINAAPILGWTEQVWTLYDNTYAVVTVADLEQVIAAGSARMSALHVHYGELKAEVNAAETAEAVAAIEW